MNGTIAWFVFFWGPNAWTWLLWFLAGYCVWVAVNAVYDAHATHLFTWRMAGKPRRSTRGTIIMAMAVVATALGIVFAYALFDYAFIP